MFIWKNYCANSSSSALEQQTIQGESGQKLEEFSPDQQPPEAAAGPEMLYDLVNSH